MPVHGQPEDIYEQISSIIMEYIKPEESIILNVLSATGRGLWPWSQNPTKHLKDC